MKYIISEQQYVRLSEALGVPDSILDAAEEFYDIFSEKLKSITEKEGKYVFRGPVDITIGDKTKVNIDEYTLIIEVEEYDGYEGLPQIISFGMGQSFKFDRKILMKRIDESSHAEFTIEFGVSPNWEPNQLYEEFIRDKDEHIGDLAHEIKHKYDKQVKRIDLIGRDAEYSGAQQSARFRIPVIDDEFLHYLYYTSAAESLVRATEVASILRSKKVTKSQFRDFLEKNKTFLQLIKIKNFTFEKFISGIRQKMDRVDGILDAMDKNPENMTEDEKINEILRLLYVNLANTKLELFVRYIGNPMEGIMELFREFTGIADETELKVDKIKEKFQNYIVRYKDNPTQYFKDEIDKFHNVANQMIKKLSKLYAMAQEDAVKTESIINWEFHRMMMEKKNTLSKIEPNLKKIV